MASLGIYNRTYFKNHPEECKKEAVLYCVVLVNKKTQEREAIKIGIAKGRNWKDVIRRARGFTGYELRIQKTVSGYLEDIYYLEEYLHELWNHKRLRPTEKFGGHTECFELDQDIIRSIPATV
jgi:hypothetical protein